MFDFAFFVASSLMGLGIGIDVAVATIARFRDASMTFWNWTVPVSATHIIFPAFGYYGWWVMGTSFQTLGIVLGVFAFAMMAAFIFDVICEWIGAEARSPLSPIADRLLNRFRVTINPRILVILAVSMDALWSGPAKAAQAESGQWLAPEVAVSFLVAGAVVALVAELALLAAIRLRKVSFRSNKRLTIYLVIAKYCEVTILLGFGILSLWNAFSGLVGIGSLFHAIALSAVIMAATWMVLWQALVRVQLDELTEDGVD